MSGSGTTTNFKNSCLGRNGFVKPAHAMFRYMIQTVLQHIIKHKYVLAISLKKNGWNCHTLLLLFTTMGVDSMTKVQVIFFFY